MSIITRYANQPVTLERRLTESEWEGNTYSAPETILARYVPNRGVSRAFWGEDVQAESELLTEATVELGDKIEGSEVRRIEPVVNKPGETLGSWVFL